MRNVMRELHNIFITYFITFWAIRDVMRDVEMTVFVMRDVMRELHNTFITYFITFWAIRDVKTLSLWYVDPLSFIEFGEFSPHNIPDFVC